MVKIMQKFLALSLCVALISGCSDEKDPDVIPVDEGQNVNTWIFNDGDEVNVGSVIMYESAGHIKVMFSGKVGLVTPPEFIESDDYTEIAFPVADIGTEIDLTSLADSDSDTHFVSLLPEFGRNFGFTVSGDTESILEGKLESSLVEGEMTVRCEFTTIDSGLRYSVLLRSRLIRETETQEEKNELKYEVVKSGISETADFNSVFYCKDSWDEGWTFTYSVSTARSYNMLGNNAYLEIYVGSGALLNGEPFDVAETEYPFSFRLNYLDRSIGNLVPAEISNTDRGGASGHITLTPNGAGLYDMEFDVVLKDGEITASGSYAGYMQPANMACTDTEGNITAIRSATLDISGDPCVLYMSAKNGEAGPQQYDIMCTVPANEWKYNKFMAFSGQGSSVTWLDGICYDSNSSSTSIFGGNWKVTDPVAISDNRFVAACMTSLYGRSCCYAYYYGIVEIIK